APEMRRNSTIFTESQNIFFHNGNLRTTAAVLIRSQLQSKAVEPRQRRRSTTMLRKSLRSLRKVLVIFSRKKRKFPILQHLHNPHNFHRLPLDLYSQQGSLLKIITIQLLKNRFSLNSNQ